MLDFLTSIGDTLSAFLSYCLNLIHGLVYMIGMIPKSMGIVNQSMGYLPSVLVTFAGAGIAICIVLFLIGR